MYPGVTPATRIASGLAFLIAVLVFSYLMNCSEGESIASEVVDAVKDFQSFSIGCVCVQFLLSWIGFARIYGLRLISLSLPGLTSRFRADCEGIDEDDSFVVYQARIG